MYTSLIFAFLMLALTLYLLVDYRRVTGFTMPYLNKLGRGKNASITFLTFTYLAFLGASIYIVYKYILDPVVPISYSDVYNNLVIAAEADSDYIGDKISNLEGDVKLMNFGVGTDEEVDRHFASGRDFEPKLVSPNAFDSCGPLSLGACGGAKCDDGDVLKNGRVMISPVREFPHSWVQ